MSGSLYPDREMDSIGFPMAPGLPNAKPLTRQAFNSAAAKKGLKNKQTKPQTTKH